jgi:zinc protease
MGFNGDKGIEGVRLVEKVERKGDEMVIPYEKYVLDNGLTLVIHEDHSDPIVHLDVTYHVGSARELPGRSGFAHFFEHMMFQGSEHVADEQHFKIITEAGGDLNGTTNSDRTNYFETVPSNQLETVLWLEADRMGFLLDSVTQRKFEVQRATVKNERGQNYDNRPYGLVNEKVSQALYPTDHPYHWPTIGYLEDLDRVDVTALKEFFMRWYGPNNATVTVAGDVNPEQVVGLVKKYFGSIPRGPEVVADKRGPAKLEADRYISYADRIRFPLIQFTYPTVGNFHPDEAPLDVLADILGGSKTSIFYQTFEKAQVAVQSAVFHPCRELGGEFKLQVLPYPGKTLEEMETLIRRALATFENEGVKEEDLARFRAKMESQMISGLETVHGKAAQLAQYNVMLGNPNYIQKDLERYQKVTAEDVMRVYRTYIRDRKAVIISAYPVDQPQTAKPDNFKFVRDKEFKVDLKEYQGLRYNKAKDDFDRSKRPAVGPSPSIKVPVFWKENFDNGLALIGAESKEVPKVTVRIGIKAGHRFEDRTKAGLAELTAALMNESTKSYSSEQLAVEMEKLGSDIEISASDEEIIVNVSSLTKNIDRTLQLVEEMLLHPKFDQADFDRLKNEQLEGIRNQVSQATVIATNAYKQLLYGKDHVMALPTVGDEATVSAITHADVKDYHAKWIVPNISQVVVVGSLPKDQVLSKLGFLKSWPKKAVNYPTEPATPADEPTTIYLIDKAAAPQSEIRMGYLSLPYDATGEFYRATLMNFNLGGNFNSRINQNLRETKGWTYGASSRFSGSRFKGSFTAAAGVKASSTDSAVFEFISEIRNMAEKGIRADELDYLRKALGQEDALKYEAGFQKAGFLSQILRYDLPADFTDQQSRILESITAAELNSVAKKLLQPDRMRIVIVGDKATIQKGLTRLKYPIKEMPMAK